jgi:HK97 family phage major capsid protein
MDALEYFRSEKEGHVTAAQEIVDNADSDGRGLTDDERETVKQHTAKATEFAGKIKDLEDNEKLRESVAKLGRQLETKVEEPPSHATNWGEAVVASDFYRTMKQTGFEGKFEQSIEFMGAAGDPVLKSTGTNADAIAQQFVPGLVDPGLRTQRLTLADLFSQGQATGGTIRYPKATLANPPSDTATNEGADKPGAEFTFDDVTATLSKLAAFIPISEEMWEDSPAVRDYINSQLPAMVERGLEAKLATALYAGAGLTAAPATLTGGSNGFDAIAAGINELQTSDFFDPDGLFIHPDDYWALRIDKDGNEGYYGSGPWAGPSANPWGLRTVVSASATAGSPVVGNFRQGATLWRKGGTRLEASNSHDDYFQKNLIALRAELRYALTIYYSEAFVVVDVTGS